MLRMLLNVLQKKRERRVRERVTQAVARNENVVDLVPALIEKREEETKYNVVNLTSCGLLKKRKDFSYRSTPHF